MMPTSSNDEIWSVSPVSPLTQPNSPVATPLATEVATPPILTPVKEIAEETISFNTADGVELQGTVFGQGKTAVIIIPGPAEGAQAWANQAKAIAAQGFTVLTYDLREQSDPDEVTRAEKDLEDLKSAIDFMKDNGASDHILIGPGDHGILAIKAAGETNAKAVVTFSTPLNSTAFSVTAADLQAISGPKLFIDTENSPTQPAAVQMFEWSNSPKTWRFLPGSAQGAGMYEEDAEI